MHCHQTYLIYKYFKYIFVIWRYKTVIILYKEGRNVNFFNHLNTISNYLFDLICVTAYKTYLFIQYIYIHYNGGKKVQ